MGHPNFLVLLVSLFLVKTCQCFYPTRHINITLNDKSHWNAAGATWYGAPQGAGSDGGACGYKDLVERPPFSAMISAGGPSIYRKGSGCGVCYKVRCTENQACSGNPVIVTITDECPGCTSEAAHFDLSGTAFGAMAKPGLEDQLRNAGVLHVQFRKIKCSYPGVTVAVTVDPGSNSYYFAATIEFEDGHGILKVELQQHSSGAWMRMFKSHGATWALNAGYVLQPPFSLKLTQRKTRNTLVLDQVIPVGWNPGQTYVSLVNF